MNKDQLFVNTIKDLEKRLTSRDEYEILMIAGLLRKLLLDGAPLVDQVNRSRKLKIKFIVNERSPEDTTGLSFWSIENGLDPDTSVPHLINPKEVKRSGFLFMPVMFYKNELITVRDVISQMSNIEGAIHSGLPKSKREERLKELTSSMFVGGLPAGIRLLKAIARVTIKGLTPLKDNILN